MFRSLLVLFVAALLAATPAHAQDPDVAPLSADPPVELEGDVASGGSDAGEDEAGEDAGEDEAGEDGAAAELPDTGAEPVVLLLLGIACVSGGAGLRLRLGGA